VVSVLCTFISVVFCLVERSSNCGAPPGGAVGPLDVLLVFMRDIFVMKQIWAQGNIYFGRHLSWLKYFTYHLMPALASNYTHHVLSPAEVRYVFYSLADLYVKSVYFG
jgi:hypothetical protein